MVDDVEEDDIALVDGVETPDIALEIDAIQILAAVAILKVCGDLMLPDDLTPLWIRLQASPRSFEPLPDPSLRFGASFGGGSDLKVSVFPVCMYAEALCPESRRRQTG